MRLAIAVAILALVLTALFASPSAAQIGKEPEYQNDRQVLDTVIDVPFSAGPVNHGANRYVWAHPTTKVVGYKSTPIYRKTESTYAFLPHPVYEKTWNKREVNVTYTSHSKWVFKKKVGVR